MSDAVNKKIKPFDDDGGWIEYDQPPSDNQTEAVKSAIEARVDALDEHRDELLGLLRSVREQKGRGEPFDTDRAWRQLSQLAWTYCWRETVRREITLPAKRRERLLGLAKALRGARRLTDALLQSDVADDLCSAWEDAPPRRFLVRDDDGSLAVVGDEDCEKAILLDDDDEFTKAVEGLSALQTAASRAADAVPRGDGRPEGTAALPWDFIEILANIYRDSTGATPGAGTGPFSRFVYAFVGGLGRSLNITYESMVAAIKVARRQSLAHAAATKGQSPFGG